MTKIVNLNFQLKNHDGIEVGIAGTIVASQMNSYINAATRRGQTEIVEAMTDAQSQFNIAPYTATMTDDQYNIVKYWLDNNSGFYPEASNQLQVAFNV